MGPFLGVILLASGPGTGNDLWVGGAAPLVVFAGGSGDSNNSLHKYNWSHLSVQKTEESNDSILDGRGAISCPVPTQIAAVELPSLSSSLSM